MVPFERLLLAGSGLSYNTQLLIRIIRTQPLEILALIELIALIELVC